ncbi:hypothetical protein K0M31_017658 [Melipona bicolor]|uniref:Uncharacterized protein n=1 Tax=Melipona bicolor TaxID=60889 RepID=A0AA40G614_9HYME|nr:hypothetical protein K0M31_017658 [Melipona bicolor]
MSHPRGSEPRELRRSVYKLPEALEFSLIKTTRAHATPYAKRVYEHTLVRKPPANPWLPEAGTRSPEARRKARIQMAWSTKDAAMPLAKLPLSVFSIRVHGRAKSTLISGVPFRRDSEKIHPLPECNYKSTSIDPRIRRFSRFSISPKRNEIQTEEAFKFPKFPSV